MDAQGSAAESDDLGLGGRRFERQEPEAGLKMVRSIAFAQRANFTPFRDAKSFTKEPLCTIGKCQLEVGRNVRFTFHDNFGSASGDVSATTQ